MHPEHPAGRTEAHPNRGSRHLELPAAERSLAAHQATRLRPWAVALGLGLRPRPHREPLARLVGRNPARQAPQLARA